MRKIRAGGLLETVILNEIEKKPRYLVENKAFVVRKVGDSKLYLFDFASDNQPWCLFAQNTELICSETNKKGQRQAEVSCFAVDANRIAAVSCGYRRTLHTWTLPNVSLDYLLGETEEQAGKSMIIEETHTDIGEHKTGGRINFIGLQNNTAYLAEDNSVEKAELFPFRTSAKTKFNGRILWSLFCGEGRVYCGFSDGTIEEMDEDLNQIKVYKTGEDSTIKGIKSINFNGHVYLFGINNNKELFQWKDRQLISHQATNAACFDAQIEQFKKGALLCVYIVKGDNQIATSPVAFKDCTESYLKAEQFQNFIENPCGEHIQEIKAAGDEVYISSDAQICAVMNKAKMIKNISTREIEQLGVVKYATRGQKQ